MGVNNFTEDFRVFFIAVAQKIVPQKARSRFERGITHLA
jgi:hypothetical protein